MGASIAWDPLRKNRPEDAFKGKRKNQNEGKNPHTEGGRHLRYPRTPGGQEEKISWLSIMDGLSPALASGSTGGVDGSTRHSTTFGEVVKVRAVQAGRAAAWSRPSGEFYFRLSRPIPSDCRRLGASSPAPICHDPPGCGTRCRGKDRVQQPGGWRICAQRPSAVPAPAVKASQGLTTEGSDPFRGS